MWYAEASSSSHGDLMPWDLQATLSTARKDVQQLVKMAGFDAEEMSREHILAAKGIGKV